MKKENRVIVLSGLISAGKSTFGKYLSEHLETQLYEEPVKGNVMLELYYENQEKFGFPFQIEALATRFKMIKEALINGTWNILDRSLYEDRVFYKTSLEHTGGDMRLLQVYDKLYKEMLEEISYLPKKQPDLTIFMDISLDTMLERIIKRGREFEQWQDNKDLLRYYTRLYFNYQEWISNFKDTKILRIDANREFENDIERRKELFKLVETDIKVIEKGEKIK
jgi:deoxyadenosine/deoxycytidine kinase